MKQKIFLMLALLTFCLVQNPAQAQGIFTPEEILSKYSSDPNSVVGLIMKVKFTGTNASNWEVKSGSSTIAFIKNNNPDLNANTEYVVLKTFSAITGQPGWYSATGSPYTPKEPESPCNRHYESAVKFIVDTPVVHTFTVNGKTGANVIFSPGMLQYRPATNEWRFALRQFDRVGYGTSRHLPEGMTGGTTINDNTTTVFYDSIDYANKDDNGNYKVIKNVPCNNLLRSKTYQGWIDMFAWGTSGQGRKVGDKYTVFYYPYEVSSANFGEPNNYGYGPSYGEGRGEGATNNNFDKKSGMNRLFDWGYANYIREYNGSVFDDAGHWQYSSDSTMYHTGIWRTPTVDEWQYMLIDRIVDGNDSAFTYVRLQWGKNDYDTVSGMIIYPDGFSFSEAGVANLPFGATTVSVITMPTWEALQEAGCVFFPSMSGLNASATGLTTTIGQMGTNVYAGWASTTPKANNANCARASNFAISATATTVRYFPRPVRLVQDYWDPCKEVEFKDTIVMVGPKNKTFTWEYEGKTREVSTAQKEHYIDTIFTEFGCDSVIFHLIFGDICESITQVYKDTTVQLALTERSFTWEIDGQSFKHTISTSKTSEEFKDTLRTEHGCDSIFYTLTLHYPEFSVADGTKVTFSPGNLQYKASPATWRFAEKQYSRASVSDNTNPSSSKTVFIDLFGWGCTGINSGTTKANPPYYTNTNNENYTWVTDWGAAKIGDYEANTWKTPMATQWNYVLYTRTTTTGARYSMVRLKYDASNTVPGIIIYPDKFTWPTGVNSFTVDAANVVTDITSETLTALEKAGCAFLPVNGYRYNSNGAISATGQYGYYWSQTPGSNTQATAMEINIGNSSNRVGNFGRTYGFCVRLIRDITQ